MKNEKCEHNWRWNYDCFEDARILDGDSIGIPAKCILCGLEGIEWYVYSHVQVVDEVK